MQRLATLSSSLSANPIETLVHCADINIQVGILALSHGKRFFAQTMMIGSILSDILLVSFPLLTYSFATLINYVGAWLLPFHRCFRQVYNKIQDSYSRRPLVVNDHHGCLPHSSNGFILDLSSIKQDRYLWKGFNFLARFGWRFTHPLSAVSILPADDTSLPLQ